MTIDGKLLLPPAARRANPLRTPWHIVFFSNTAMGDRSRTPGHGLASEYVVPYQMSPSCENNCLIGRCLRRSFPERFSQGIIIRWTGAKLQNCFSYLAHWYKYFHVKSAAQKQRAMCYIGGSQGIIFRPRPSPRRTDLPTLPRSLLLSVFIPGLSDSTRVILID